MLKKFSCHNFRNIEAEDLEFNNINLLIGPNNSGKSNFIKAVTFFSEMIRKSHEGTFNSSFLNAVSRNGWDRILNINADKNEAIDLKWELEINEKPVEYRIAFNVGDSVGKCHINLEEMNDAELKENYKEKFNYFRCHDRKVNTGAFSTVLEKGRKNKRMFFDVDSQETILKQFKDILLANKRFYDNQMIRNDIADLLYGIQNYFKGYNVYATSQFDTNKIRQFADSKNTDMILNSSATNLVNVLNNSKLKDSSWKYSFEKYLRELIPELNGVEVSSFYDKLVCHVAYDDKSYDLSDVSEGTVKAMILNTMINMANTGNDDDVRNSFLAVDEPENNLHPAWQKVIGRWFLKSECYQQYFISTHSPDFLDVFTDDFKNNNVAVFVFDDMKNNKIRKITYEDIKDELGDWELGDLYRVNDPALGGWPW